MKYNYEHSEMNLNIMGDLIHLGYFRVYILKHTDIRAD